MNEVLEFETFTKTVEKCDKSEKEWIEKMKNQLKSNLLVGKPLGFEWLREKKLKGKENLLLGAIRGLKSAALRSSLIANFLTLKRLHLRTEVRSFRLLSSKRLFYIINQENKKALLVAFGDKKSQQRIIKNLLKNKRTYFNFFNELFSLFLPLCLLDCFLIATIPHQI